MNSTDQQYIDLLYGQIFGQHLRYTHYNAISPQPPSTSVWNKTKDEKIILDNFVEKYKNYYIRKIKDLKSKLKDLKEHNVNSYLTYDADYYVKEYIQRTEEVDKYILELEVKTVDTILSSKLGFEPEWLKVLYPDFMLNPSLIGRLFEEEEKDIADEKKEMEEEPDEEPEEESDDDMPELEKVD